MAALIAAIVGGQPVAHQPSHRKDHHDHDHELENNDLDGMPLKTFVSCKPE